MANQQLLSGGGWTSEFFNGCLSSNELYAIMWSPRLGLNMAVAEDCNALGLICLMRAKAKAAGFRDVARILHLGEMFRVGNIPSPSAAVVAEGLRALITDTIENHSGLIEGTDIALADPPANATLRDLVDIVRAVGASRMVMGQATCAANALVSYAKKGSITAEFSESFMLKLKSNTARVVPIFEEIVRGFFDAFGSRINAENAHEFVTAVTALIPAGCQPMITLIAQMANSGMTACMTISSAMSHCPGFDWPTVAGLFPAEMVAATEAIQKVKANPYVGYTASIGSFASSKYRNLAWVAKELLIRAHGESGLKNYNGWTKRPAQHERLTTMIDGYLDAESQRPVAPDQGAVDRMLAAINEAPAN